MHQLLLHCLSRRSRGILCHDYYADDVLVHIIIVIMIMIMSMSILNLREAHDDERDEHDDEHDDEHNDAE